MSATSGGWAWGQFRAYDVIALAVLTPVVLLLAVSIPGDLANHQGRTLRGTATVITVEPLRGGTVATFQVRSATGAPVGVADDIYGIDGDRLGSSYPVNYIAPEAPDVPVSAYAVGEDPLAANLTVLTLAGSAWLVAAAFTVRRLRRLLTHGVPRAYRATGRYEVGRGRPNARTRPPGRRDRAAQRDESVPPVP